MRAPWILIVVGILFIALSLYFLLWGLQIAALSVPLKPPADALPMNRAELFVLTSLAFAGIGALFLLVAKLYRKAS